MFGDKKLDRHRFEYAQMVRTPTPQADEKNSLHLYAASKDRDTTEQKAAIYDRVFIRAINVSAIVAGVSATAIPAAFSASIFPAAVPFPPETIAPA
jgi:hypothetical protein